MNKYSPLLLTAVVLSMTACGGGGSADSTPGDNSTAGAATATPTPAAPGNNQNAQVLTGRLVDSAVAGMRYETATQSGFTGADGSFSYLANETVTFSLGDIVLPSTNSSSVVTPLDLFSTEDLTDPRVVNLTRLLQTLDEDGNADNGIVLTDDAVASATGLSVDFASANFDTQVVNLVANGGSVNTSLIGPGPAIDHFQETLFDEGIRQRPQEADNTPPPAAPETPAAPDTNSGAGTHPLVGTTAEFTNNSHGISGTLTLIDDRTFEVSNFFYDGGGVSVYFYLGTDGDYLPSGAGIQVGELLNTQRYTGETLTVTLPDGVTLDDFNGVSVWCEPFFISFGEAEF